MQTGGRADYRVKQLTSSQEDYLNDAMRNIREAWYYRIGIALNSRPPDQRRSKEY